MIAAAEFLAKYPGWESRFDGGELSPDTVLSAETANLVKGWMEMPGHSYYVNEKSGEGMWETQDMKESRLAGEKVVASIQADKTLKKAYEFYKGRNDKSGNDMQAKFVKFVAEHPGMGVGYDTATNEFKAEGFGVKL